MTDPIRPDHDGPCITDVVGALLEPGSRDWLPEVVGDAAAVVLLLFDGLGWASLREHTAVTPELSAMRGGAITTVLPSSTASALTSLTTGKAPTEHGITGIVVNVDGELLHTLRWNSRGRTEPPAPERVQAIPPFGGRPIPVVTRAEFAGSGFTRAHLRGARFHGWQTPTMLVHETAKLVDGGAPFVYVYYDGVDVIAHTAGTDSASYRTEVGFADRLCGELLDAVPPTTAVVVTADHGQVDLRDEDWIETDGLSPLVAAQAGDARCRFLYAREGMAGELLAAARDLTGDRGWVLERDRALDEGWFGPRTRLAELRIGDVVLLGRDVAFADPAWRTERSLRSVHGSATEAEMLVPLLAARGRRAGPFVGR